MYALAFIQKKLEQLQEAQSGAVDEKNKNGPERNNLKESPQTD